MIIGLSGKAASGKDTIANEFVKEFGFIKISFADPVKRMAMEMFDFTPSQLWGDSFNRDKIDVRYGFSPRDALQKMATSFGRDMYEDVWVNATKRVINKLQTTVSEYSSDKGVKVIYTPTKHDNINTDKNIIISDCRFLNEFNFIKKQNWPIFRVKRNSEKKMNHISEIDLDNIKDSEFTKVIDNNNIIVKDLVKQIYTEING